MKNHETFAQVGWQVWIELYAEEDESFTEDSKTGRAKRLQQRFELMREQSTDGGGSTGNRGGRGYEFNPEDPTTTTRPLSQR